MLQKAPMIYSRSSWWLRLVINLKHAKLKQKAILASDIAVKETKYVYGENKQNIVKLRIALKEEEQKIDQK